MSLIAADVGDQIANLYNASAGGTDPGDVLVIDPTPANPLGAARHRGRARRRRPTKKTRATGPAPTRHPRNGSGWHYQAHFEYVVLYDSSPAGSTFPPRKWTRVPFNTVRIQRPWETRPSTVTSPNAWLPDDRGLTEHAKQGTLLVTPGMTFSGGPLAEEQEISGWFSVEYPMLDWTQATR